MNYCLFQPSIHADERRVLAYREAMAPIIEGFSKRLNVLPTRFIQNKDGTLMRDDTYPTERKALLTQLEDISRVVYESFKVESFH